MSSHISAFAQFENKNDLEDFSMLHRDHPKHDAEFRKLEHLFPDWEQCDHFLDSTMHRFDIKEW